MKSQKLLGLIVILLLSSQVFGEPKGIKYDKEPCPVRGFDYLCEQIKCPYSDSWCGIKKVKLSFRIDINGEVSRVHVIRSGGEKLDQIAIQGVTSVEWEPALIDGKEVPVRFQLPIHFRRR